MNEIFELTAGTSTDFSENRRNPNAPLLGNVLSTDINEYDNADIVILGFQKTENFDGNIIREEFYKLTNFGINKRIFDLGNIKSNENFGKVISKVLADNKRLIIIGGGNESTYPGGVAMSEVFGKDRWLAINVDSYLDVISDTETAFKKLLDEKLIVPKYFYEIGFQPYYCSPKFFKFLQNQGVKMVSLEQLRSRETADLELRELIRLEFINHSRSMSIMFNFSMNAVRASDAPGVTASSPFGLRAGEFLTLVQFAAKLVNTKLIQFTEIKPSLDIQNTTSKLAAIAMHRFCSTAANV